MGSQKKMMWLLILVSLVALAGFVLALLAFRDRATKDNVCKALKGADCLTKGEKLQDNSPACTPESTLGNDVLTVCCLDSGFQTPNDCVASLIRRFMPDSLSLGPFGTVSGLKSFTIPYLGLHDSAAFDTVNVYGCDTVTKRCCGDGTSANQTSGVIDVSTFMQICWGTPLQITDVSGGTIFPGSTSPASPCGTLIGGNCPGNITFAFGCLCLSIAVKLDMSIQLSPCPFPNQLQMTVLQIDAKSPARLSAWSSDPGNMGVKLLTKDQTILITGIIETINNGFLAQMQGTSLSVPAKFATLLAGFCTA